MNYIELINLFWQIRRKVRLSSSEADLYYFLMQESNARQWENPFECTNGIVCATIGFSEKTMIDARNRLKEKGLIDFEAGQRRLRSPVYTLLYNKKGCRPASKKQVKPEKKRLPFTGDESNAKSVFVVPTFEEVEAYCNQRGGRVDARKFIDFYTAKDWMIGRNKMKNWQAAVRTWEKSEDYMQPVAESKQQKSLGDERF